MNRKRVAVKKWLQTSLTYSKLPKDRIQRKEKRSVCEIQLKVGPSSSRLDQNCLFSSGLQQLTLFMPFPNSLNHLDVCLLPVMALSGSPYISPQGSDIPLYNIHMYRPRSTLCPKPGAPSSALEGLPYSMAPKVLTVLVAVVPVLLLLCCLTEISSEWAPKWLSCPSAGPQHLSVCTCLSLSDSDCMKAKWL